jgi:serine protease Do
MIMAAWTILLPSFLLAQQAENPSGKALPPQELFKRIAPSVFVVETLDGNGSALAFGSGVSIAPGRIVTNKHVLEDGISFNVRQGGKVWSGTVTHVDPNHDLAELDVHDLSATPARLRSSVTLAVGERVYAIGAPRWS